MFQAKQCNQMILLFLHMEKDRNIGNRYDRFAPMSEKS